MLEALLAGKLSREQENLEDVLTSAVFGNFRYAPSSQGLYRFLACARRFDAAGEPEFPLRELLDDEFAITDGAEIRLWPNWCTPSGRRCQPDAEIHAEASDGRRFLIAVEAKYRSGKSSDADFAEPEIVERDLKDQIAFQWKCLVAKATAGGAAPYLIYLTANVGVPHKDLREALYEFALRHEGEPSPKLLSLSWRELWRLFRDSREARALYDLHLLTERLGLSCFHGVHAGARVVPATWRFDPRT